MNFVTLQAKSFISCQSPSVDSPSVHKSIPTSGYQSVRSGVKAVYFLLMRFSPLPDRCSVPRDDFSCYVTGENGASNYSLTQNSVCRLSASSPSASFFCCKTSTVPRVEYNGFYTCCNNLVASRIESKTHYAIFTTITCCNLCDHLSILVFLCQKFKNSTDVVFSHVRCSNKLSILTKSNVSNAFFHWLRNFLD